MKSKVLDVPRLFAAVLAVLLASGVSVAEGNAAKRSYGNMVLINGGSFVQFAREAGRSVEVVVKSFLLDRSPVTNAEYLRFVKANPEWRRSRVKRIFADREYLINWSGDLSLGVHASPNDPVTYVSWYAARAYCEWRGKRLPTLNEWDYASGIGRHVSGDEEALRKELTAWYGHEKGKADRLTVPTAGEFPRSLTSERLWEWVEDYSSVLLAGSADGSSAMSSCGGASSGFSDPTDYAAFLRYAFMSGLKPEYCLPNVGFRGAIDVHQIKGRMK